MCSLDPILGVVGYGEIDVEVHGEKVDWIV
jgi:hypothetical protein